MATDSAVRSVTNTLTGTTADTVTISQLWPAIEVTNHDATTALYVRQDGTTAVAEADGTTTIMPSQSKVLASQVTNTAPTVHTISIVGNSNKYTIEGVA